MTRKTEARDSAFLASYENYACPLFHCNVVGIYERTEVKGDWRYTRYVAEIRVTDTEKGEGIDESGMVYARYWKRRWIAAGHMPRRQWATEAYPEKEKQCECISLETLTTVSVTTTRMVGLTSLVQMGSRG